MRGRLGERDRRVGVRTSASRGCRGTERGCHGRLPELIGRNRQVGLRACSLDGASARGGGRPRGGARDGGACTAPIQARLAHKRAARTCSCTSPLARLAPCTPAVSARCTTRTRHGDDQAREQGGQGRLDASEGQAVTQACARCTRVVQVQAQPLGFCALSQCSCQEDCPLRPARPVTRGGWHARISRRSPAAAAVATCSTEEGVARSSHDAEAP